MSQIRIWRAADRRPQPWKNGGGLTAEVATFPVGAGIADFDWRISVAEVAQAGPFSRFDGVDRVLTVLEGELALAFHRRPDLVRLTNRSAPFAFAGDVPVSGAPLGGPVRDLNVMVRRGRARAHVERFALAAEQGQKLDMPAHCVLVALGDLTLRVDDVDYRLADLDAIELEGGSSAIVEQGSKDGVLIVITLARPA